MARSREALRQSKTRPAASGSCASEAERASGFRWSNAEMERALRTGEDARRPGGLLQSAQNCSPSYAN